MTKHWLYRPDEAEREALMDWMADHPEFDSVSKVVREGVIRLITTDDPIVPMTNLQAITRELIDLLYKLREAKDE